VRRIGFLTRKVGRQSIGLTMHNPRRVVAPRAR
jgi:hypothetical protein